MRRPSRSIPVGLIAIALGLGLGLVGCGSGGDGTGTAGAPQAQDQLVISGTGGSEDVRNQPVQTVIVQSFQKDVFVYQTVGTMYVVDPPAGTGGENNVSFVNDAQVGLVEVDNDGNSVYVGGTTHVGTVRVKGNGNTVYVVAGSTTVDNQGIGNAIVNLP